MPSLSESFPTIGLLISGTRKLFSKSKKQPTEGIADPTEDFFSSDSPALELEATADLEQIAYQAGTDEVSTQPGPEKPDDFLLAATAPQSLESPAGPNLVVEASAQSFPSALEESPSIPGLYETWVDLEERSG